MGITGELVRSVFSRNRSVTTSTHETYNSTARSNTCGDKKRWISVRSYLCGDEFNSVAAEQDSASVRSSEATVTQPLVEDFVSEDDINTREDVLLDKYNSTSNLFRQEDAAILIQSAFRNHLARRRNEEIKDEDEELEEEEEPVEEEEQQVFIAMESSPSRDSIGTSMEVQTGHSVEVMSVGEESVNANYQMPKKARTQVFRIKEDWDDSTVSSNIIQMRIQNRLEATNRRERALAYAFAQQLRICSKRKQTRSDNSTEHNMGWSWLERWMATRIPECSVESRTNKQFEAISNNRRIITAKKIFDVAEEKESCGSNEVSLQFDTISMTGTTKSDCSKTTTKKGTKSARTISRRKTVPRNHCPKEQCEVIKK